MKKTVDITIKARYYIKSSSEENVNDKFCWLVAHGYGQLAEFFIRHFDILGDHHKVLAPEGLHRYYLNGNNGRVGSSWMTKLEREQDIKQYIQLLDKVMDVECPLEVNHIIAFGFSQGAATISRWLCSTKYTVNTLVLWAGAWPHDMEISHNIQILKALKIIIVVGIQDQFLGKDGIGRYLSVFDENKIQYKLIQFDGDHRLDKGTLLAVCQEVEDRI